MNFRHDLLLSRFGDDGKHEVGISNLLKTRGGNQVLQLLFVRGEVVVNRVNKIQLVDTVDRVLDLGTNLPVIT